MANEEHLRILKGGVSEWNAWRAENSDNPDLAGANLAGANLAGANLAGANLEAANLAGADLEAANLEAANLAGANLAGADLTRADLIEATLAGANLTRADLTEAYLTGADLTGAYLEAANLTGAYLEAANLARAYLTGANLTGADLTGADLNEVDLFETVFGNTSLEGAINLETCKHYGPSTIDLRTIQQSNLPNVFLRGCGLPDHFIDYLPPLLNQPIQFYSCFISYSSVDQDFVKRLYADLQNNGVRCWFAPEDMKTGDKIRDRIDKEIRLHDKTLIVLSEESINSDWVEAEVETAIEKEGKDKQVKLFPVRIEKWTPELGQ